MQRPGDDATLFNDDVLFGRFVDEYRDFLEGIEGGEFRRVMLVLPQRHPLVLVGDPGRLEEDV